MARRGHLIEDLSYFWIDFAKKTDFLMSEFYSNTIVRTALIAIGLGGSHGHKRTHLDAIHTASEQAHINLLSPTPGVE